MDTIRVNLRLALMAARLQQADPVLEQQLDQQLAEFAQHKEHQADRASRCVQEYKSTVKNLIREVGKKSRTIVKHEATIQQHVGSIKQHVATIKQQQATIKQQQATITKLQQVATVQQQAATGQEYDTTTEVEQAATIKRQQVTITKLKQAMIALEWTGDEGEAPASTLSEDRVGRKHDEQKSDAGSSQGGRAKHVAGVGNSQRRKSNCVCNKKLVKHMCFCQPLKDDMEKLKYFINPNETGRLRLKLMALSREQLRLVLEYNEEAYIETENKAKFVDDVFQIIEDME